MHPVAATRWKSNFIFEYQYAKMEHPIYALWNNQSLLTWVPALAQSS
jgi:hypothetical protein